MFGRDPFRGLLCRPARGKISESDSEHAVFLLEKERVDTLVLKERSEPFSVFHFGEGTHLDRIAEFGDTDGGWSGAPAPGHSQQHQEGKYADAEFHYGAFS